MEVITGSRKKKKGVWWSDKMMKKKRKRNKSMNNAKMSSPIRKSKTRKNLSHW